MLDSEKQKLVNSKSVYGNNFEENIEEYTVENNIDIFSGQICLIIKKLA